MTRLQTDRVRSSQVLLFPIAWLSIFMCAFDGHNAKLDCDVHKMVRTQ